MDASAVPLNDLVAVFGSSALFLVASLLVWRRYVSVADRYLTYLERENEAYRNSFQTGGVISPLRPPVAQGTSAVVVNGSARPVAAPAGKVG